MRIAKKEAPVQEPCSELLGFGSVSRPDRQARVQRSVSAKVGEKTVKVKRSVSAKVGEKQTKDKSR